MRKAKLILMLATKERMRFRTNQEGMKIVTFLIILPTITTSYDKKFLKERRNMQEERTKNKTCGGDNLQKFKEHD